MYKKLTVIVSIFFVIDVVVATPVHDASTLPTVRKRDVSHLRLLRKDDGVIYGNGIPGHEAEIVSSVYKVAPNGNYYFAYKQTDLQEREETGVFEFDPEINARKLKVTGYYSYIRPDGVKQRVDYTADDEGFAPQITQS